jgi:hypothetical protein
MDRRSIFRRWWKGPLLLGAALASAGCQTSRGVTGDVSGEQLRLSAQAINAGDLDQAKVHLSAARAGPGSPARDLKVQSLQQLIAGAEALMEGDAEGARAAWSRIQDPTLRTEVRHKARLIGINVPVVPDGSSR